MSTFLTSISTCDIFGVPDTTCNKQRLWFGRSALQSLRSRTASYGFGPPVGSRGLTCDGSMSSLQVGNDYFCGFVRKFNCTDDPLVQRQERVSDHNLQMINSATRVEECALTRGWVCYGGSAHRRVELNCRKGLLELSWKHWTNLKFWSFCCHSGRS